MKSQYARWFGSISFTVLLVSSVYFLANSTVSRASSISNDEVTASSGSNRFVVWVNGYGCGTDTFFRRSTDNGATWEPKVNLANSECLNSSDLQIAVSGSNVYVVWQEGPNKDGEFNILFIRSTDNSATWRSVTDVALSSYSVSPQLASSGSNVYVVWVEYGTAYFDIFLRRSTDIGNTWKSIVNLSNNPGQSVNPQIAVAGSNVYVAWDQKNPDKTLSDVFFRRSTDNGATWKFVKNLSSNGHSLGPDLAASGSNVYVAWQGTTASNVETFFRRSADNGATWNAAKNLSNNAGDSVSPQVAFSGTNVYVAWSDDTPGNNDIFIRRSTDNGATWKPFVNLSNNPGPSVGLQIGASGTNVFVVWDQKNLSETLSDVFFKRSTDNGATWQASKNLSSNGHSLGSDLSASGANVYVVWTNNAIGNGDIFFQRSTDNGATWQASKNLSSNTSGSFDPQIGV